MAGNDVSFIPGMDVGPASDTPSGFGMVGAGDGVNAPIAASTGAGSQTTNTVISGTDRNTPKGPPIFRWNKYDFMYNSYFGLGGFYDGTALYKSQVEKDDQFTERRATTHYRNFFRQIVDATYVPVFSAGASRKTTVNGKLDEDGKSAPMWNAMIENVDCRHRHIRSFTKKIVRHARILGVSFAVVDNFRFDGSMVLSEVLKKRLFPYVYMRLPQQVEASLVKIDEFCKISEIVFREAPEKIWDVQTKSFKMEPRWKRWTTEYSVLMKKDEKENRFIEIAGTRSVHNLGEVPVFPILSSEVEDDTVLPHPDFYNVAKSNWALYNIDSAQMRLIRSQMFAILCLPDTTEPDANSKQAVHPLQGFRLPPNTQDSSWPLPMYLAPPIGPYTELAQTVKDLSDDIFRQAGQEGVKGVQKATSGVAKAYDFQAQEYVLKETAKMAKYCEEEVARIFKLYVPQEQFEYDVQYEDSYRPSDTDTTLKMYDDYVNLDPGPLGRALALKQSTRAVFDDLNDEEVQPVLDEIDERAKEDKKTESDISPVDDPTLTPEQRDAAIQAAKEAAAANGGKGNAGAPTTLPKKVKKVPGKRGYSFQKGKQQ